MPPHTFELFADYFQFYLQDEKAPVDLSEAWTPEAVERMLALARGAIGVGTVRNMNVPVEVEILSGAPDDDFARWDRVNECSLQVPSGRIVVAGCTDDFAAAARIPVAPGTYRARVYYGGLSTASADALEGDDHYRVALWLAPERPAVVLKAPAAQSRPL